MRKRNVARDFSELAMYALRSTACFFLGGVVWRGRFRTQNVALFNHEPCVRRDLRPPCYTCITPFANRHEGEPNTHATHTPAGYICMSRTSAFVLRAAGAAVHVFLWHLADIWLGGARPVAVATGHWVVGHGSPVRVRAGHIAWHRASMVGAGRASMVTMTMVRTSYA